MDHTGTYHTNEQLLKWQKHHRTWNIFGPDLMNGLDLTRNINSFNADYIWHLAPILVTRSLKTTSNGSILYM